MMDGVINTRTVLFHLFLQKLSVRLEADHSNHTLRTRRSLTPQTCHIDCPATRLSSHLHPLTSWPLPPLPCDTLTSTPPPSLSNSHLHHACLISYARRNSDRSFLLLQQLYCHLRNRKSLTLVLDDCLPPKDGRLEGFGYNPWVTTWIINVYALCATDYYRYCYTLWESAWLGFRFVDGGNILP